MANDKWKQLFTFAIQQLLLTFQSPTITAETLIFTNDTVARNDECDRVSRTRTPDSTHRSGRA